MRIQIPVSSLLPSTYSSKQSVLYNLEEVQEDRRSLGLRHKNKPQEWEMSQQPSKLLCSNPVFVALKLRKTQRKLNERRSLLPGLSCMGGGTPRSGSGKVR